MIQNNKIRVFSFITVVALVLSSLFFFIPEDFVYKKNSDFENKYLDSSSSDENLSIIADMIKSVDKQTVYGYLKDILDIGIKPHGSDECDRCAEYLYDKFEKMGLSVEYQTWSFPFKKGRNVIATHSGINSDNGVFIVCAHFDTWPGAPGANDDAL